MIAVPAQAGTHLSESRGGDVGPGFRRDCDVKVTALSWSETRSVALKRLLYFGDVARGGQHQRQQDARLLRGQILAGDDAGLAQAAAGCDAPGGAAALHDDNSRFRRLQ